MGKVFFLGNLFGGIALIFGGMIAQANTIDVAAAVGYISGIGLACIAVYAKYRDERRKQDVADRESRRNGCEEKLWGVQLQLTDAQKRVTTLEAEIVRWQALWEESRSRTSNDPPCKSSSGDSFGIGKSGSSSSAPSPSPSASPPSSTGPTA